ncbi:MAG: nicotinate phosphoribosyltransferase, partial [Gammaproteobacteria bacterium]|nr:nicotinate phosphoribosyltransferase [Gammaproteobacteria bacterium]
SEHSTITCWGGPDFEADAFENMVDEAPVGATFACVSDSYDVWKAIAKWKALEDKIIAKKQTLVIRPDSGNPVQVVSDLIELAMGDFATTTNKKGFRVLPDHIRVIQGDGVEEKSIGDILVEMEHRKLSADNIAFGMGGGMLQHFDRDVLRFAMKASAINRAGQGWADVYKDPITDTGKRSKKGRLELIMTDYGTWETQPMRVDDAGHQIDSTQHKYGNKLKIRYSNGETFNRTTFQEVRDRAAKGLV